MNDYQIGSNTILSSLHPSLISKDKRYQNKIKPKPLINQLPINLFHSNAQYRKMLITNGKNIDQNYNVDGIIRSLEYVNTPIFQSKIQKQYQVKIKYRKSQSTKRTQSKKNKGHSMTDCCCCCCDNFCSICAQNSKSKNWSDGKRSIVVNEQRTTQILTKRKIRRHIQIQKKKQKISQKKNYQNILFDSQLKCLKPIHNKQQQIPNNQNKSIRSLVMKSMCKYQQWERNKKIHQILDQKIKQQKAIKLKQRNQQIRVNNQIFISKQKSRKSESFSIDKKKIRFDYWDSIKCLVKEQLKNCSIGKDQKKCSLEKSKDCHKKIIMSNQQIDHLRKKYEQIAKNCLRQKINTQKRKKKKIAQSLKKLEKKRIQLIQKCPGIPFKPSPKTIECAFANLSEPQVLQ